MMSAKQRRMWVLPAPDGLIDKSDRYEIDIFYSFAFIAIHLPLRVMFTAPQQISTFQSPYVKNIFVSARKTNKNN